jgi:hypothetical protein
MNFTFLNDTYGEGMVLAWGGGFIGCLFGFFAQRSRFCLRAAVIEFGTINSVKNSRSGCSPFPAQ